VPVFGRGGLSVFLRLKQVKLYLNNTNLGVS
jgi:hypothetical protein